jgi:hypothetical protein
VSGYLERMAVAVLKPDGAIHPVVGSLFSPPRPAAAIEAVSEESVLPSEHPTPTRSSPLRYETDARAHREPKAEGRLARLSAVHQTTPPIAERHAAAQSPALVSLMIPAQADHWDESLGDESLADREVISSTRAPAALVVTAVDRRPAIAAIEDKTRPVTGSSRSLASHSRASGDIEIHIGRIEVTAVHPAPTSTTPVKQPRRAPSLDEYLKRRDGRS